jgi:GNAT superfamily N-acetyltransferase
MALQLVRATDGLPEDFPVLRAAADAEGHRHMARLEADFASGAQRFDGEGEALLAAYLEGALVAIGGVTQEPANPSGSAMRMRRLYVLPPARRRGVATSIANALLSEALNHTRLVTVHAGDPGAARFWEALGYAPVEGRPWSHQFLAA